MGVDFKRRMCSLNFDRYNYDLLRSDTAAFAFLKDRFYIRFDSILLGDSKQVLEQHVENEEYGKAFVMTLEDGDGNPVEMACRISPTDNPDAITLKFCPIDVLNELDSKLTQEIKEDRAIISLYGDYFFSYNKDSDLISFRHNIGSDNELAKILPLNEFEEHMTTKLCESSHEDFAKFISNVRMGIRSFSASLKLAADGSEINLSGLAVYDGWQYVETIGKIGLNTAPDPQINVYDPLTGVYLRDKVIDYAKFRINEQHARTGIAIIDIDDFKNVNDNYGHTKGDEVLKKTASFLMEASKGLGYVGRIGGDEFFIVYDNFENIWDIRYTFMGVQSFMGAEFNEDKGDGFNVTLSIGCAVYPDDFNGSFDDMFKLADAFLYRAKDKGKDRYIVYNKAKHGPTEEILKHGFKKAKFDRSELICALANSVIDKKTIEIDELLAQVAQYFDVERIVLYNKTQRHIYSQCGQKRIIFAKIPKTISYLYEKELESEYNDGFLMINCVEHFKQRAPEVYRMLTEQSVYSLMQYIINGKSGNQYILSLEAVNSRINWNMGDVHYYRILVKLLEEIL